MLPWWWHESLLCVIIAFSYVTMLLYCRFVMHTCLGFLKIIKHVYQDGATMRMTSFHSARFLVNIGWNSRAITPWFLMPIWMSTVLPFLQLTIGLHNVRFIISKLFLCMRSVCNIFSFRHSPCDITSIVPLLLVEIRIRIHIYFKVVRLTWISTDNEESIGKSVREWGVDSSYITFPSSSNIHMINQKGEKL